MVVYDLVCAFSHKFEGWFSSLHDYEHQYQQGLLSCPICNNAEVHRVPTASYVNTSNTRKDSSAVQNVPTSTSLISERDQLLKLVQDYLDKHSTNVGDRFVEEARKIHYGETEASNIHGVATQEEVTQLNEEGIEIIVLPTNLIPKNELN